MKVLVTGATGFIGSHLVTHLLARGDDVRILTRKKNPTSALWQVQDVDLACGDLTSPESWYESVQGVDVVYHAALIRCSQGAEASRRANVRAMKDLLEACAQNRVPRFVFISSVSAYAHALETSLREEAPLGGANIYGQGKAEAEALLKSSGIAYGIIRPCVAYGECDTHNFTPRLLRWLQLPIVPTVARHPEHIMMVHAADVAEAAILVGTQSAAIDQAYNITGGELSSLKTLAKIYGRVTGKRKLCLPLPIGLWRAGLLLRWVLRVLYEREFQSVGERFKAQEYRRSFFLRQHIYEIDKAHTELGYVPQVDLELGLRRTVAWYQGRMRDA